MKTLLVIAPGKTETGEHLASHFCSNWTFAWGDLYANRKERIEEWTKRFGEFEVKYIDDSGLTQEELLKRNKSWYNSQTSVQDRIEEKE
jgi:hypothetical protein